MNSQQMMEEIDRLTRLCEEKDAEIEQIASDALRIMEFDEQQLSEAQAQIAMQAEFISGAMNHVGTMVNGNMLADIAQKYHEVTSETVASWRAKETEPLRREVAMLNRTLEDAYHYAEGSDTEHANKLVRKCERVLSNSSETALAYELEVENRGAVKALRNAAEHFKEYDDGGHTNSVLLAMAEDISAANKG